MFRRFVVAIYTVILFQAFAGRTGNACRLLVPPELLNGCIFDPMIVSVSHSGFSVTRENCNAVVSKNVFAEQPLVYYGRAKSVCGNFVRQVIEKEIEKCFTVTTFQVSFFVDVKKYD